MPIYEFHCADCDAPFETFVRSGHDEDAACPTCHGTRLRRELSVFASAGRAADGMAQAAGAPARGGCCGGACGCH
ncbi:MAG TPA: zinc ribbon domain-containing protein [Candidatus Binataceae bacterium]|nr:zinc ribbon domain-containing protein [Candidatus Binataceae bacterium]